MNIIKFIKTLYFNFHFTNYKKLNNTLLNGELTGGTQLVYLLILIGPSINYTSLLGFNEAQKASTSLNTYTLFAIGYLYPVFAFCLNQLVDGADFIKRFISISVLVQIRTFIFYIIINGIYMTVDIISFKIINVRVNQILGQYILDFLFWIYFIYYIFLAFQNLKTQHRNVA